MNKKVVLEEIANYSEAAAAASRLEDREDDRSKVGFFVQRGDDGGYCVVRYQKA